MPTIPQLPAGTSAGPTDEFPVSQSGVTRSVTLAQMLASTQPGITLPPGDLLGRVSLGPGGPEAVALGQNLAIAGGALSASTDPSVTATLSTLTAGLALNNNGQITNAVAGPVSLGQVQVNSSAPSRTLQAKAFDTLNVVDYGAVPGGGDSTAAFNAAFTALSASGGEIFIPAGDYQLSASLVWAGKPVTIRGAGKAITRLHMQHTGIGFDISQTVPTSRTILRDFSAYAENHGGQTAAVARLVYPQVVSNGYVSAFITDIEVFGYPGSGSGISPFPQTFLRGFVLNNCWSVQINNVSWFGPPSVAGATTSAVIELALSYDTRIAGLQAYYGHAAVIQTDYCEGIYFTNPLIVGVDLLFTQTDITKFTGYQPGKAALLGLWAANGEVNCALGTIVAASVSGAYFVGIDCTRDTGPPAQVMFNLIDVSNLYVVGCNFVGGPGVVDIAFQFQSTYNSSGNVIGGSAFQDMATIISIGAANGTVGLTTFGINPGNVPLATAFSDNSAASSSNLVTFQTAGAGSVPAGIACTKDHIFAAVDGSTLFRIASTRSARNYVQASAAKGGASPAITFAGGDASVGGTIATQGGPLYLSAAGGLFAPNLTTTKPAHGSGQIWNNGGVLNIA